MVSRTGFIKSSYLIICTIAFSFLMSCTGNETDNNITHETGGVIYPDYRNVKVPPNIAPLNFMINAKGAQYTVNFSGSTGNADFTVKSRKGKVIIPIKKWKSLLEITKGGSINVNITYREKGQNEESSLTSFTIEVAEEPVDSWIAYRLIHPGYYSWSRIKIMQRSLEDYSEQAIVDNQVIEKNCINCHSFNNNSPDRFMIHMRGSLGATYFYDNNELERVNPKVDGMPGGATYPAWHPGGRFIAYSSNVVRQSFYSQPEKNIEVFDLVSSLIVYDRQRNETFLVPPEKDTTKYLSTFPSWSPDGKYIYFCMAVNVIDSDDPELEQIKETHYNIVRKAFDEETMSFGETEIVYNASGTGKSASFPRISPDGNYLVFTLHDYGTFPIWHAEADLHIINMETGVESEMTCNSTETESYHTWSTNGKWLIFSSKRLDGRSARPHLVYINSDGSNAKEFVLPQKDPARYDSMLESFNIPEFITGKVSIGPRDIEKSTRKTLINAIKGNPDDSIRGTKQEEIKLKVNERPIH